MALAALVAMTSVLPIAPAHAANDRELYLYYTHTRETVRIVYKRNGKFIQSALSELNQFLRDWRRDEPARMDPALFDLLWEVYQDAGSNQPIHIVSAYRSPATNAMLAANSSGVADNSQHMRGKAIDFFIPGVPVSRIREIGFRKQVGGVGYYPTSGSPFVHLDTGSVRAWPRMTEAQLRNIFPDGRTLHLPSNGRVLSQQGYQVAQAEWQRCHRVPCNAGAGMNGSSVQVADGDRPRTLWDMITGGNENSANQQAVTTVAAAPAAPKPAAAPTPTSAAIQQVAETAPTPPVRPSDLIAGTMVADAPSEPQDIPFQVLDAQDMISQVAMADSADLQAPLPPSMSASLAELREATPSAYAPSGGGTLSVAESQQAPVPQQRPEFEAPIIAAIQPIAPTAAEPEPLAIRPSINASSLQTASVNANSELDAFASLFDGARMPTQQVADPAMDNAVQSLAIAPGEFFAPELDTVTQTMLSPASMTSASHGFALDAQAPGTIAAQETPEIASSHSFTQTASLGPDSPGFGSDETIWVHYSSSAN